MALEPGSGSAGGGVRGFGMLMVEALLEAASHGCKDGFGRGVLWWVAAWGGVVRSVSGTTSTMNLEEDYGVKQTPSWLQVFPFLEGRAPQARGLEAEAGDGEKWGGEVERVAGGAVPGVGYRAPDILENGRAAVILVDGCLFD